MSYESEAADQVVRMTLNGVEIAARLTGRAAERLAALVYAIIKDNKKTRGKTHLNRLLRTGQELTVFSIKDGNMAQFKEEAKRVGILYCILKDRKANDGLTDVMIRESDSKHLSRIIEKNGLYDVSKFSVRKSIEKDTPETVSETAKEATNQEKPPITERQRIDAYLDEVLAGETPKKEEPEDPFRKSGRSGHSSGTRSSRSHTRERADDERNRPSVKKELKEIRKEQDRKDRKAPENTPKSQEHIVPKKREGR